MERTSGLFGIADFVVANRKQATFLIWSRPVVKKKVFGFFWFGCCLIYGVSPIGSALMVYTRFRSSS